MSNQNFKPAKSAEQLKTETDKKIKADAETLVPKEQQGAEAVKEWISPLDVNYKELTDLIGENSLEDYIGDRLPEEEVKRINTDYQLYLKNK
jgi:hypothetical protein